MEQIRLSRYSNWLKGWRCEGSLFDSRYLFHLQSVSIGSETHTASYHIGTRNFTGGEAGQFTIRSSVKVQNEWRCDYATPSAFMACTGINIHLAWYSIQNYDNNNAIASGVPAIEKSRSAEIFEAESTLWNRLSISRTRQVWVIWCSVEWM
jgi:hypothetical protein